MRLASAKYFVWVDCEMTGLDPERDELVEIAAVLTDEKLRVLGPGFSAVIKPSQSALDQMNDLVRTMHTESGLLERLDSGDDVSTVEEALLSYIRHYARGKGAPLLAGNTIGMDRRFISRYMPRLDEFLHYRSIDVSTIKELARRWCPKSFYTRPKKKTAHRALDDILESILELQHYRETVFCASAKKTGAAGQGIVLKSRGPAGKGLIERVSCADSETRVGGCELTESDAGEAVVADAASGMGADAGARTESVANAGSVAGADTPLGAKNKENISLFTPYLESLS